MKKYNVIEKKTGTLLLFFIIYDNKMLRPMLGQFKKLKRFVDLKEIK